MSALLELAESVEALTGPDREVDTLIAFATGWRMRDGDWIWPKDFRLPIGTIAIPPFFTGSSDAAMTLVPEGWDYCLSQGVGEPATASLAPNMRVAEIMVEASTLALAICAAALRSLASGEGV